MPAYITSPFKPMPLLLNPGQNTYLFGSFNDHTSPCFGYVISNSAVTTTATLTFRIVDGNAPIAGQLITVVGCANSANFNVTNATIATATTTNEGICTVTYTIVSTSQATTFDGGQVLVPQIEIGETPVNNTASIPAALPAGNGMIDDAAVLTAMVFFPGLGGISASASFNATVKLQGSDIDRDQYYQDIATVTTVTSGTVAGGNWQSGQGTDSGAGVDVPGQANQTNYAFYRFKITGMSGLTTETICALLRR